MDNTSPLVAVLILVSGTLSVAACAQATPTGVRETRPFQSLALGVTFGTAGVGFDLATPVNDKINVRAGASFLRYSASFTADNVPVDGTLHLASARAVVDYFPRAGSFHLSPGLTMYSNDRFSALVHIDPNQTVTFNDQDYTSDPNDPIRGTALVQLNHRVAPRFTVGWGNMIRHHTAGFSFPFEAGIEYIKAPTLAFDLVGTACDSTGYCSPIQTDPDTQESITEEQISIKNDLRPLRFFPILSIGISYKFGH